MAEEDRKDEPLSTFSLSALAFAVGLLAGLGATAFRVMTGFFHNLFFLGKLSLSYDPNVHVSSNPWGVFVVLVPVLGALGVALVQRFARETRGSGVPDTIEAVYYKQGFIRPVVSVIKPLASALSLGSGASVGQEGPALQIGAAVGSLASRFKKIPAWQRVLLVTAGASGGMAAVYDTPIGGMIFAMEIILHEVSIVSLLPIAVGTATATYVARALMGPHTLFSSLLIEKTASVVSPRDFIFYIGLGVVAGAASAGLIKGIDLSGRFFSRKVGHSHYFHHALGMLSVGVVLYLTFVFTGHYYVASMGYATMRDVLSGALAGVPILLLFFVLKLAVTSGSLGSGASGGIFAPAMFMGATMGSAYSLALNALFPGLSLSPPSFAIAGMAAMTGGTTGAAIASLVMVFELTMDHAIIIPMAFAVAFSHAVRSMLLKESFYTLTLARRGHYVPLEMQSNFYQFERAADIMEKRFATMPSSATVGEFVESLAEGPETRWCLVVKSGRLEGVAGRDDVLASFLERGKEVSLGEVARRDYMSVTGETTIFDVIVTMRSRDASVAVVQDPSGRIKGIIGKEEISRTMTRSVGLSYAAEERSVP
ncbi:MAG: chloride channel protein [Nitrospirota bacterium]|jgi:CIC family chloride channel protein